MKILIEGDSWGKCWYVNGALESFEGSLKHCRHQTEDGDKYLGKVLAETGHVVDTTAEGGSSNDQVIDRLWGNKCNDYDLIIIFQTAPLRNLDLVQERSAKGEQYVKLVKKTVSHMSPKQFDDYIQDVCFDYYEKLHNVVSKKYNNTKTLLIGGNSKVDDNTFERFIKSVSNDTPLEVLHHSILESLSNRFESEYYQAHKFDHHTELTFTNIHWSMDDSWNPDLVDYIWNVDAHKMQLFHEMRTLGLFTWPDNGHLNRQSMLYVADDILYWAEQHLEVFKKELESGDA